MISEAKNCIKCQKGFVITNEDKSFYNEINVPSPTRCPDCRQLRRLRWRNERSLYIRKCDATGEQIFSALSPDQPFPVYKNDYWFSEKWSALDYGRDFDFNRPFFEQFHELHQEVPQMALCAAGNQNCEYVNQCGWSKDCYLIFEADVNEKCMYGNSIYDSISCIDNLYITKCELCYECIDCENCYNLKYSQNCKTCTDSYFLKNCIGCTNCFGCANLRNKQYHIFNKPYSKEDYENKLRTLHLNRGEFSKFTLQFPHKCLYGTRNENSSGDYLFNTQNCHNCFDLNHGQDCKFVYNCRNMKKVYDVMGFGGKKGAEFCYECHTIGDGVRNLFFCDQIWSGSYDLYYCQLCFNSSHNLFGCIGLNHSSYCILNKQYTKEEYEELLPKIIEHMKKTGEWGEFFPSKFSPYKYEESVAQDYFPIEQKPQPHKEFKLTSQELNFYKKHQIPTPTKHPDQRHKERLALRNPRKLWKRSCANCNSEIETSFSHDSPFTVHCEKCYLETVY